jgi:hypothetical protein
MEWILISTKSRVAEYAIYYLGQLVETVVLNVSESIEQYVKDNYGELLHLNENS